MTVRGIDAFSINTVRVTGVLATAIALVAILAGCGAASDASAGSSATNPPVTCSPQRPAVAGTTSESITVNGATREYSLHIPTGYDGNKPTPVVMTFHGRGQTGPLQLALTGFENVSNEQDFILIAPTAVNGEWNLPDPPTKGSPDILFVNAMLDKVNQTLCTQPQKTYASGMSRGSAMVFLLACLPENQRRFAAFGGAGASFYRPVCSNSQPAPLIYFHGTKDPVVPFTGGTVKSKGPNGETDVVQPANTIMKEWAKHNGCSGAPAEKTTGDVDQTKWASCAANAQVDYYAVTGGGHTWPGTNPQIASLIEKSFGKTTQDANASELMWQFFKAHTLPAS